MYSIMGLNYIVLLHSNSLSSSVCISARPAWYPRSNAFCFFFLAFRVPKHSISETLSMNIFHMKTGKNLSSLLKIIFGLNERKLHSCYVCVRVTNANRDDVMPTFYKRLENGEQYKPRTASFQYVSGRFQSNNLASSGQKKAGENSSKRAPCTKVGGAPDT